MQNSKINKDIAQVLDCYPKLALVKKKNSKCLIGDIDVFDSKGTYLDSYGIRVNIPVNYPYSFPELFETSQKFPHIADRHISDDGSCCVCSLQEADMMGQKGISIIDYFRLYVIPYLANQIYFDHTGKWANGDYEHGIYGIFQFYRELFKVERIEEAIELLSFLSTNKMNRNDLCFCESGLKFKRCHLEAYRKIKGFTPKRILVDLTALKQLEKEDKGTMQ